MSFRLKPVESFLVSYPRVAKVTFENVLANARQQTSAGSHIGNNEFNDPSVTACGFLQLRQQIVGGNSLTNPFREFAYRCKPAGDIPSEANG